MLLSSFHETVWQLRRFCPQLSPDPLGSLGCGWCPLPLPEEFRCCGCTKPVLPLHLNLSQECRTRPEHLHRLGRSPPRSSGGAAAHALPPVQQVWLWHPRLKTATLSFKAAGVPEPVYCILLWESWRKQCETHVYKRM